MKQALRWNGMAGVGLFMVYTLAAGQAQALELTRRGRPVAALDDGGHEEQAALLRRYVKALSGADLPAASNAPPGAPRLVLEITPAVPGLSDRPTALQGYRIRVEPGRASLSARTPRGLTYAVYGLLEDHLGIRFFAPDCEVVPKTGTLRLREGDEVREPAFQVRSMFMALGPDRPNPWELANRGGGLPGDILVSRHGFYDWIHPSRYLEPHPEWFPLIDGKRQQHWLHGLCYSNPELARELASNIAARIRQDKRPEALPIPVGQGDGFIACGCPECRRIAAENESEAGPVILLLNRALEALAPEFPRHTLITFAYAQTIRLPKVVKPHPNLWINIVSSSAGGEGWGPFSGGDMIGPVRDNPANALYQAAAEQWPRAAPGRVAIWHWSTDFNDHSVEWPNLFTMADNLRFWRDRGVAAAALQTTGGSGNWGWLKHWVWLKLMWNPDADPEPLVREFLAGYYGPRAAPILGEYHRFVEQVRRESGYGANACDSRAANAMALVENLFRPEALARMDALLEKATAAAARERDPVYAARVRHARAYSVDQLKLVEAAGVKPYPGGYFYPPESVTLHRVRDPRDGSWWKVPGGAPDMPARVERRDLAMAVGGDREWGAGFLTRFWFRRGAGGRLTRLESGSLALEVCPNLLGTFTSLIHKPTGKELLAGRFPLLEWPSQVQAMDWVLPETGPRRLVMEQRLQTDAWFNMEDKVRVVRTLDLDEQAPRLTLARRFESRRLYNDPGMPATSRFPVVWRFRVERPEQAALVLEAGGRSATVPLDRTNVVDFTWAAGATGDWSARLDRGDGLEVRLKGPLAGWDRISVQPDPATNAVAMTLHGGPVPVTRQEQVLDLPGFTLDVGEPAAPAATPKAPK